MLEINLLPWREAEKEKRRRQQGFEIFLGFLFSLSLLFGLHFALAEHLKKIQAQILLVQRDLDQMNQRFEALGPLASAGDEQKGPELDLSAILKHQECVLHFLRQLANLLPETVYTQTLHFDQGSWSLEGFAQNMTEVLGFAEHFKNSFTGENGPVFSLKEKQVKLNSKDKVFSYQLRYEQAS